VDGARGPASVRNEETPLTFVGGGEPGGSPLLRMGRGSPNPSMREKAKYSGFPSSSGVAPSGCLVR
jgi:hypothetical protein